MKIRWLGLGLGTVLTLAGVIVPAATANADSTCYTGCTPPPPSNDGPPPTKVVTVSSSALAFTGADIEGMTAIGGGALIAGGVLVRRSRRRNRAHA
jgi:LPXTG-motif cell wall-anchored protein